MAISMLAYELIKLIENVKHIKSEDSRIELKRANQGCPKIYDTLSSFSNQSGGGIIIFGIDQDNDFDLCGVYDADDLQKKATAMCLQMEPVVRPLCTVVEINGKAFMSMEIHEIEISQKPCFYKGAGRLKGSYVRVGDADIRMTEYEVYSFEAYRKKVQDELRITERAIPEDLDTAPYRKFVERLSEVKPNQANLSEKKIKRLQGFTVDEKPTLAGIMMFSDYPQSFYPQLCVTAVSIPGNEIGELGLLNQRFDDNERIEGTIPQMLDQTIRFIKRNMKVRTIIDEVTGQRTDLTEYPVMAIREIILNALIHRDYSIHTDSAPITVRMFKNRIEIENPGGLYGRLTLDNLGKVSADTRNPFIAKSMEVLGETENRFSGIPIIKKSMQDAHLPAPKFENEKGIFRVTLYNTVSEIVPNEEITLQERILAFCSAWKSRKELESEFSDITIAYLMSRYVNPLVEAGRIELLLSDTPKSKNQKYRTVK